MKTKDTILTSKGTTSIPAAIRQAAGLFPGSGIAWEFEGGEIRARRREGGNSKSQTHIRKYAGTWQGHCSGAELLRRTRPLAASDQRPPPDKGLGGTGLDLALVVLAVSSVTYPESSRAQAGAILTLCAGFERTCLPAVPGFPSHARWSPRVGWRSTSTCPPAWSGPSSPAAA